MKKLVVANLKSSLNDDSVSDYASIINNNLYDNLVICPSSKYLNMFNSENYYLGIQDIDDDLSFEKLKQYKVKYVILGHFDKRKENETNKIINDKIKICIENGLKVILCVGNYENQDVNYVLNQIYECIDDIREKENIILAYEPFYMINSNDTIDSTTIYEYINKIRDFIKLKYNTNASILYGGNVNDSNIDYIMNMCDGVLVGRLCYDVNNFTKLLQKI